MTSASTCRCAERTVAPHSKQQNGYTLVELLIALALSAILFTGLGNVVGQAIGTRDTVHENNDLTEQARFAMQQMLRAVSRSPRLLLPLADNPKTNWREHVRAETVPASPPEGDSTLATAVLAVTLDPAMDLDGNGTPDADNDGDGRFDEDLPGDNSYDNAPGLFKIDDDGDGSVDESAASIPMEDNDEDDGLMDDYLNALDDDGDGSVDEDIKSDMNGDGDSGVQSVDDDGDGLIDEHHHHDDDEDGVNNDDWYDPVVFYLDGSSLLQRTPVPWDESGGGGISGQDFILEPLAENVTRFRVERLPQNGDRAVTVDLTLALTSPVTGETVNLNTRIRVGGAL
jgi:prepilin-type N-terminal cleavage/methylation domain-containing protein